MLTLVLLSMAAVVGVSMTMDTASGDDAFAEDQDISPNNEDNATGSQSNVFEIVSASENVTGTDGDDSFTVDAGPLNPGDVDYAAYHSGDLQYYLNDEDDTPVPTIDGGAGADSFVVQGGHAIITTGHGADSVDATNMQGGKIYAGDGDYVRGSEVAMDDFVGILIDGAGVADGGASAETLVARGDGATLNGGGGNDTLIDVGEGSTLNGGDGDDFIDANAIRTEYSGNWDNNGAADAFVDVVDAGEGDDRIEDVANGDIVALGAGNDTVLAYYDHSLEQMGAVTITDFNAAEDQLSLRVVGLQGSAGSPTVQSDESGNELPVLTGRFEILEGDGDSHVFVDDFLVAVFENTTGLIAEPYDTYDRYGSLAYIGLRFGLV